MCSFPAIACISYRGNDKAPAVSLDWAQADLHRYLPSILVASGEFKALTHRALLCSVSKGFSSGRVPGSRLKRNKDFYGFADELLASIAEDCFCLPIYEYDPTVFVDHDHGVGGCLQ